MASAVITFTAGSEAGATMRKLAQIIQEASMNVPDRNSTGASVTLTINDTPSAGSAVASVLVAGGGLPTQTTFLV